MQRFLIEMEHEVEEIPCARVIKKFLESGSHMLRHTDWGCKDGVHKGWLIVEANSKEEARYVLPPLYRKAAKVVGLNYFTDEEIDAVLAKQKVLA